MSMQLRSPRGWPQEPRPDLRYEDGRLTLALGGPGFGSTYRRLAAIDWPVSLPLGSMPLAELQWCAWGDLVESVHVVWLHGVRYWWIQTSRTLAALNAEQLLANSGNGPA